MSERPCCPCPEAKRLRAENKRLTASLRVARHGQDGAEDERDEAFSALRYTVAAVERVLDYDGHNDPALTAKLRVALHSKEKT